MLYQTKNPHGGDMQAELDFSANVNPYGTPESVKEAVVRSLERLHCYPDPHCTELVQAIALHENVPPEWVLCSNGAAELIYSFCMAAKSADEPPLAVELAPTFLEYGAALEQAGCRIERYALQGDFCLKSDFLTFLTEKMPKIVILCNPNNPTGRLIETDLLEEILIFCEKYGIFVLLDECFLDFTDGRSMKNMLDRCRGLLILKAFTKTYGMAGLRLGYGLSANAELLSALSKTVQPWNISTPAQMAGVAALNEKEYLCKTKSTIAEERAWLRRELEACGFDVCPSDANFLLFRAAENLNERLHAKGISIRSCDNYHGLEKGWYRVAVRLHEDNLRLIAAIREV